MVGLRWSLSAVCGWFEMVSVSCTWLVGDGLCQLYVVGLRLSLSAVRGWFEMVSVSCTWLVGDSLCQLYVVGLRWSSSGSHWCFAVLFAIRIFTMLKYLVMKPLSVVFNIHLKLLCD